MGRASFEATPLRGFTEGIDGKVFQPNNHEIVVDEKGYFLGVLVKGEDGLYRFKSPEKDLRKEMDELRRSGVFENARAFVHNRTAFRLFYDNARETVRIDPDLRFPREYRYYAIREMDYNENGTVNYVTGFYGEDNEIQTNLVDFDIDVTDDDVEVSKPGVANLVLAMNDAKLYSVEYYDQERRLIKTETYQSFFIKNIDFDKTPGAAVTDMRVSVFPMYTGDTEPGVVAARITRGQSLSSIDIRAQLQFANNEGRLKDITHELRSGGRLVLEDFDELDNELVTGEGVPPQKFTLRYYLHNTNGNPEGGETPEGGNIDESTLSISKEIYLYVIEDSGSEIVEIYPVLWTTGNIDDGTRKVHRRMVGLFRDGSVRNITPEITSNVDDDFKHVAQSEYFTDIDQTISVTIQYGYSGDTLNKSYTLRAESMGSDLFRTFINGRTRFVEVGTNNTMKISEGVKQEYPTIKQFVESEYRRNFGDGVLTPNRFRVKSGLNPTVIYAGSNWLSVDDIDSEFTYEFDQTNDPTSIRRYPLIVELAYVETDTNGVVVDERITGAFVAHVNQA